MRSQGCSRPAPGDAHLSLSAIGPCAAGLVFYAVIAQLAEQLTCNQQVAGSTPAGGSNDKLSRKCWAAFYAVGYPNAMLAKAVSYGADKDRW